METGVLSDFTKPCAVTRNTALDPSQIAASEQQHEIYAMQRLWQAVILQALQDLKTLSAKAEVEAARSDAFKFFERRSSAKPDADWRVAYEIIVLFAGWNPDDMQERYRRFISRSLVDYKALHLRQRLKPRRKQKRKKTLRRITLKFRDGRFDVPPLAVIAPDIFVPAPI